MSISFATDIAFLPFCLILHQAIRCNSPVCRLLLERSVPTTTILTLGVREMCSFAVLLLKCESTLWTLLQAVQIMAGLFNIGLTDTHPNYEAPSLASMGVGIWLGALVSIAIWLYIQIDRVNVMSTICLPRRPIPKPREFSLLAVS